jgi:hypothetical protein
MSSTVPMEPFNSFHSYTMNFLRSMTTAPTLDKQITMEYLLQQGLEEGVTKKSNLEKFQYNSGSNEEEIIRNNRAMIRHGGSQSTPCTTTQNRFRSQNGPKLLQGFYRATYQVL